jgi:hypothetical protein
LATEEVALCPCCLFPNLPEVPWCKRCGAAITAVSTFAPLESAQATGLVYRGAVRGHPKLFVLVIIWLWFLPSLLAHISILFGILSGWFSGVDGVFYLWWAVIGGAISAILLYRVTWNYFNIPKPKLE